MSHPRHHHKIFAVARYLCGHFIISMQYLDGKLLLKGNFMMQRTNYYRVSNFKAERDLS